MFGQDGKGRRATDPGDVGGRNRRRVTAAHFIATGCLRAAQGSCPQAVTCLARCPCLRTQRDRHVQADGRERVPPRCARNEAGGLAPHLMTAGWRRAKHASPMLLERGDAGGCHRSRHPWHPSSSAAGGLPPTRGAWLQTALGSCPCLATGGTPRRSPPCSLTIRGCHRCAGTEEADGAYAAPVDDGRKHLSSQVGGTATACRRPVVAHLRSWRAMRRHRLEPLGVLYVSTQARSGIPFAGP
jgi:hypothetical protein